MLVEVRPGSARPAGEGARGAARPTLIRLQCSAGLDEAKELYEWNYRKQLLRIQAGTVEQQDGGGDASGWDAVDDDIFGAEFLLRGR